MMSYMVVLPLLLVLTVQVSQEAPTLGDDVITNFKQNMAFVHGNIMAAITNLLKPLIDLIEKVPNALFGGGRKVADPNRNFISNLILGGAAALNSGIKLASTLIATPFKLAGDGMMALQSVVLGRSMDSFKAMAKQKRGTTEMDIKQLIDEGVRALERFLRESGSTRKISTKQKRQTKPKFLEGLTETLDNINDFIAEKVNEDGDFLLFLGQLFGRD